MLLCMAEDSGMHSALRNTLISLLFVRPFKSWHWSTYIQNTHPVLLGHCHFRGRITFLTFSDKFVSYIFTMQNLKLKSDLKPTNMFFLAIWVQQLVRRLYLTRSRSAFKIIQANKYIFKFTHSNRFPTNIWLN